MKLKIQSQRKAGVILSYLQTGLSMLISLAYTPVMLRLLGQNEYGVYQAAASVISYLGLLKLGFSSSYVRFFSRYKVKDDTEGVKRLNTLFMIFFCTAAAVSLVAGGVMSTVPHLVFGNKFTAGELQTSKILLILMTVNTAVSFIDTVFGMYVNAHGRFVYQRILSIIGTLFNPLLTLPLLLMGYGSVSLTVVSTLITCISFVSDIFYAKKYGIAFSKEKPDGALLKEVSVFSGFILLTSFAGTINSTVDTLLLSRFSGAGAVAVYEIGHRFNKYLVTFSSTVSSVFIPKINAMVADKNDNSELSDIMIRIGRIQFYVISLLVCGFILVGRYFIFLYAGENYGNAYYIGLIIMLASFVPYIQNIGIEIQKAKNKHIFRSLSFLAIAVCNICISIPLIKTLGINGAAVGTAIALFLGNSLSMNIYYSKGIGLHMKRFWRSMLRPAAAAAAALVPCIIVREVLFPVDSIKSFIITGCVFVALYATAVWFIAANDEEKDIIMSFIKKVKPSA